MTCDDIQHCILLMDSGELNPDHRRMIMQHLDSCAACSQFLEETRILVSEADKALPESEPSAAVIQAILNAAGSGDAPAAKVVRFPGRLTQILAYAACFAVLALGWHLFSSLGPPSGSTNVTLAHAETVSDLMISMSDEDDVNVPVDTDVQERPLDKDARLNQLAEELMRYQGFDSNLGGGDIFAAL
jgi:hypothetical protein